ncbi:hypothetical protein [Marispirochaeta aestuarii]|uniref:hypothetical protein n=1 Tax=Marispirochaeta aestuarii TaxID=1963862 RepID=UPI0029C9132A|nr:hypothetical protein [Marispirochaeta aestuarii]
MATDKFIQMGARVTKEMKFLIDQAALEAGVSTQRFVRYLLWRGLHDHQREWYQGDREATAYRLRITDETMLMQVYDGSSSDPKVREQKMQEAFERQNALVEKLHQLDESKE